MKVVIPYTCRYPEAQAVLSKTRFTVLVAHRRFGKTVLAVNHLIRSCLICRRKAARFAYIGPFRKQAKEVAWDYLKYYTRPVPGAVANETELSIRLPNPGGGGKIIIFGADNPDSLRGLYFDGVVLDEVGQMKPSIWEEITRPCLADRKGFALFIGTPKGINLFSRLYYRALREQSLGNPGWAAMMYTCDDTKALPADEIAQMRAEMSENEFRQEMLCDFTATCDDVLISQDDVEAALARTPDMELASRWPLIVGVDVARFGADATVFFPRRGLAALEPLIMRKKSNTDVAQRLANYIQETKPSYVNIDQGQGTGVIDIVRDLAPRGCAVTEVPFGSSALKHERFVNRRAEMWTSVRDWLKAGGSLPQRFGELLKSELTAPGYQFDSSGRLKLEAKDEIKKRLSHSTDLGDALALTFAIQAGPENMARPVRNKTWDPFAV